MAIAGPDYGRAYQAAYGSYAVLYWAETPSVIVRKDTDSCTVQRWGRIKAREWLQRPRKRKV